MDDTEAVRDNSQCQGWRRQERLGPLDGCWGLGTGVSQEMIGICMELMQCHSIFFTAVWERASICLPAKDTCSCRCLPSCKWDLSTSLFLLST